MQRLDEGGYIFEKYIVLTGVTDDWQIIVNDPNSPKNSKKHWDVDILVSQMKSIWKYSYNQ